MPPQERRLGAGYSATLRGKWKHTPPIYKWPSLWALLIAFALQFVFGFFPTFLSFVALAAADERRCPVALGASPARPFVAWLLGACIGVFACGQFNTSRNANGDWVFWGAMAEFYRWVDKRSRDH